MVKIEVPCPQGAGIPKHFKDGISGMTLVDLLEMLADWAAATKRHNDGNILQSIEINTQRFKILSQLKKILRNTALEYLDRFGTISDEKGSNP